MAPVKKTQARIKTKSDRITEYSDEDAVDDLIPQTELPAQPEFYKIPRRFGSIPPDTLPLGCDANKQYREIYPKVNLPFQKAARVSFGHPKLSPNRLIWGDNLHVMRQLPSNSIDLIYIDPPFFSNRNYNVIFGDQNEKRSFTDVWEGGMPSYLIWLNARLLEMKRLLKDTGSIYVHLDSHASHYVKVEMDKIFGYESFRNEIVWSRTSTKNKGSQHKPKKLGTSHDVIFFYCKNTNKMLFNPPKLEISDAEKQKLFPLEDERGRYNTNTPIFREPSLGPRPNLCYTWKGITNPHPSGWRLSKKRLEEEFTKGNVIIKDGKVKRKAYLHDYSGNNTNDVWTDIPIASGNERIGYPTQKPEALLERIINASTKEGGVVADFFCGGGGTPMVAQKLNRRWIACDQSRVAVAVTQGRLESIYEKNYEGQHTLHPTPDVSIEYWGTYDIPALEKYSDKKFQDFVVQAYGGRTTSTGTLIHGIKGETPLFVGPSKHKSRGVTKNVVIDFAKEITETKGKNHGTMIAWAFSPSAKNIVQKLKGEDNTAIDLIQIALINIDSSEFKKHVTKLHDEYESFLTFILPPKVVMKYEKLKKMTYEFDASESIALNTGSKIINVQWDFDFRGRFTPTKGFAFGRHKDGKPLHKTQYKFDHRGEILIACRVQDDLGGEQIHTEAIPVS